MERLRTTGRAWYCDNDSCHDCKYFDHSKPHDCQHCQDRTYFNTLNHQHCHWSSSMNILKSYAQFYLGLLLDLPFPNATTSKILILALITTPDACFQNIAGFQLIVINRPTNDHKDLANAQLDVEKTSCVSSQPRQSLDQSPQTKNDDTERYDDSQPYGDTQQHEKRLVDCEPEYVDSTCTDTNGIAEDASAVKDDYWKWDVDRQRFVHLDEKTGKETLCPEWFD
ncbi:hypothetical protein QBC41DRAFT_130085 [Cercophora samala]|uniref:Uncharacterized protein n=1 Tax=Cercophora samala TaxID=330535 RepID=A0AA39ZBQ2_9PEZI|nr:hypothetical protein QBC41DRAFT_130085 [Cercophora samala]